MDMLKDSLELLKNPAAVVKRKNKADLMSGIKLLAIAGAIAGAISGFLGPLFGGNIGGAMFGLVFGAIALAIFTPIGMLISNVILWIVAKVLGGKATYAQQFYLMALPMASAVVIYSVLSVIPILGPLLLVPIFGLYLLYVQIIVLRDAHAFSLLRAVATVLIIIVLAAILAAIIVAMMMALLVAVGAGALAGGAVTGAY